MLLFFKLSLNGSLDGSRLSSLLIWGLPDATRYSWTALVYAIRVVMRIDRDFAFIIILGVYGFGLWIFQSNFLFN